MQRWMVFLLCLLAGSPVSAQGVVHVDDAVDEYNFMPYDLTYFIDSTNHLAFKEVSAPAFAERFRQNRNYQNKDFKVNASYWIRLPIRHTTKTQKLWLLEFYDQTIDYLDAYVPQLDGRLFRENASGKQRVKLNVGNGAGDNWFDGGAAADIDPAVEGWHHIAFTISSDKAVVYIDGEIVSLGSFPGVDWTGCDILSIASGAPRFTEWGHLSDQSLFDELRLFNKALTQEEIQAIIAGG